MTILYKKTDGTMYYWETWEHEGVHTVHWGKVGETGQSKELRNSLFKRADKKVHKEKQARILEGYEEHEDLDSLIIQYKLEGWGAADDLDRRHDQEELMNECLGRTGLGNCDGGDIGSGTFNIFCFVIDPRVAVQVIVDCLRDNEALAGATIAVERDDDCEVLYPEDHVGEFQYFYE